MFRIVRVFDLVTAAERRRMEEVQRIFRKAFTGVPEYVERIPELLLSSDKKFNFVVECNPVFGDQLAELITQVADGEDVPETTVVVPLGVCDEVAWNS